MSKTQCSEIPTKYPALFEELKQRIQRAQVKAALAVNRELIQLYWDIGREIVKQQQVQSWGAGVIDRLSRDLQATFPGIKGFSRSNIFRMRAFYLSCEIVAQTARQLDEHGPPAAFVSIPWWHNVLLVEKVTLPEERLWYACQVLENGWSRSLLAIHIASKLYHRQGSAISNFAITLPPPQSDFAQEALKDPYSFDFLTLTDTFLERELEQGLIDHIQKFLQELGAGFSFVGRQYPIVVDGEDYYLDLLFYHLKLRCYCVVDLKSSGFKPEYAGKMNFYLSAVDDLLKHPDDQPSIGMILCKEKKKLTVEYALRYCHAPIGVSSYEIKLLETVPDNLKGSLPSMEELEQEFG
ncbi:MAG: YhcG family protein [Parachlamydiales bacterium]